MSEFPRLRHEPLSPQPIGYGQGIMIRQMTGDIGRQTMDVSGPQNPLEEKQMDLSGFIEEGKAEVKEGEAAK